MDSSSEEYFDRITRLAAAMLDVPISLISLVDTARQFFKSQIGLPEPLASERQTPLSLSFCKEVVQTGKPLLVKDTRRSTLWQKHPATKKLGIGAYLGVPLVVRQENILGALCAIDFQPRNWTEEQTQTLHDLAASFSSEIRLRLLEENQPCRNVFTRNTKPTESVLPSWVPYVQESAQEDHLDLLMQSLAFTTVLIASDFSLLRKSFFSAINESLPNFKLVEAESSAEVLRAFQKEPPKVAIIAHHLAEGNCDRLLEELRHRWPETALMVLTQSEDPGFYEQAKLWKLAALIDQRSDIHIMMEGLNQVLAGKTYLCPLTTKLINQSAQESRRIRNKLTATEKEVLGEMILGKPIKEWSEKMGINLKTAYAHRKHLFEKLNVTNEVDFVFCALKHNLHLP